MEVPPAKTPARPPRKPRPRHPADRWRGAALLLSSAVLFALGFFAASSRGAVQAPLGVPIPDPPPPLFEVQPHAQKDSSFLQRRLPLVWVERMAPQPDGLPPTVQYHFSERLDYETYYPYGVENMIFTDEQFLADGVDSQARVAVEQALHSIKVTVGRRNEGETPLQHAQRLLDALAEEGATAASGPQQIELPAGGLLEVGYTRTADEQELEHAIYILPLTAVSILFDFAWKPEHAADGRRMAEKIMRTLKPGEGLQARMIDPVPLGT